MNRRRKDRYYPELDPNFDPNYNPDDFNHVTYPDNLNLEQALNFFRRQYASYQQQLKFKRNFLPDPGVVQAAYDQYLKLRKEHERNEQSS
jgi:hypothetical protein